MTDFTLYFLEVGQTPGEKGPAQKQEVKAVVTLPLAAAAGLQSLMHQVLAQAPEMIKQAKAKSGGKE